MSSYDPNEYKDPKYHYSFIPQRALPDTYRASSGWEEPQPRRKSRKLARGLAAVLGVAVISSAAGGGTAMLVLRNQPDSVLPAAAQTLIQTTDQSGGSTALEGSVAAVAQVAADSVVEIDIKSHRPSFFSGTALVAGSGSGVIISEDGYIVTNEHVVGGTESIVVRTRGGEEYDATLVGSDAQSDLAVIKIEASGLPAVTFADSDNIQVGDLSVAIGNPLGELGGTVTSGIISATGREVAIENGATMTLLQTSAAINPGNSGGGLFDSAGHLIGVVNAKSAGVEIEGLGFAIPSNTVQKVVSDIIETGYVTGRAIMGIQIVDIQDSSTAAMYGVSKPGVYVQDPGDNEGLKSGDRFVFIDGVSIDTSGDISNVLRKHEAGQSLDVTVERDGKAVQTTVTLKEYVPEAALPQPQAN